MRLFVSLSARVPVQQLGAVIALVMFVSLVGVQFNTAPGALSSPTPALNKTSGEVWT